MTPAHDRAVERHIQTLLRAATEVEVCIRQLREDADHPAVSTCRQMMAAVGEVVARVSAIEAIQEATQHIDEEPANVIGIEQALQDATPAVRPIVNINETKD